MWALASGGDSKCRRHVVVLWRIFGSSNYYSRRGCASRLSNKHNVYRGLKKQTQDPKIRYD